ncbi:hypothetical protein HDE_09849 [Halotydeus destructor]|nr:hypothetical protein HDE_09849 [Halotydeus destructor]
MIAKASTVTVMGIFFVTLLVQSDCLQTKFQLQGKDVDIDTLELRDDEHFRIAVVAILASSLATQSAILFFLFVLTVASVAWLTFRMFCHKARGTAGHVIPFGHSVVYNGELVKHADDQVVVNLAKQRPSLAKVKSDSLEKRNKHESFSEV